ncbi:MAG TPA: DegT/DnrJ/EryC1/StrS family aminotransferase [Longimicrobium sp.]|nr:DegT/DnrJ/EryC1/StrS family aminotransferase [Longimicrobium sp.]
MSELAIHGGRPVRTEPFPEYRTIGEEEKRAVNEVMDSGVLSAYLGTWSPQFFGGPRVQKLEREWEAYFGVKHAVSMNSATSGLYAALGAAGVGPGDEVIVSPYTMSASAAGPLLYNAIPVFADIDPETFCLTAETIRPRITEHTRAVVVVDIFGQPAEMDGIMALAREHGLVVIEDAAQAPGATYHGRWAGTLGHMGVFSLNYHKHIHSGEGCVVVTDDPELAERLQLIRNHAEVVLQKKGVSAPGQLVNMLGFNYRMTELEAAIASEQLRKLEGLVAARVELADYLTERLAGLPGITPPVVRPGVRHAYYLYTLRFDAQAAGVSRGDFVRALNAEGIPMVEGYVEPIYLQPLYQQRILYGTGGSPWTDPAYRGSVSYARGICPVVERMHYEEVIFTNVVHAQVARADLDDVAAAFEKVAEHYASAAARRD